MYDRKMFASAEPPLSPTQPLRPAVVEASAPPLDIVGTVWRRKGGILACVLLGLAAALAFTILATPRYTASTKIIIDPADLKIVDKGLHEQSSFSDAQIAQVENEVRVITSTSVLGAVVDGEHLDRDREFIGQGPSTLSGTLARFGLGHTASEPNPKLDAIRTLAKDIAVKREERTYVVEILVTTRDAAKSARLADAVVAAFLDFSANQHTEASRRIADSLKGRLSELRQSVEVAEQKVVDYKQRNNIVAAVGQSVTEQQLADANTHLSDSRKRVEDMRSRYNQVMQAQRSGDPGAVPEALQSTNVTNLRQQLAQVLRREGEVSVTLGPRHPEMSQIRSQESSIRAVLREELGRIATVARTDLDRAVADQASAQTNFNGLKGVVSSNSQLAVRLRELEREVEASRTVYEAFLVRTREIAEQEQIDPADVRVISAGQVLEGQTWPPRPLLILVGGLILGLGLGLALALMREFLAMRQGGRVTPPAAPTVGVRYVA